MLKMLVACARNSSVRDSFSGMILVKAMSNNFVPGPMMLLRRASPYWLVGGAANAAVLNHSPIVGCDKLTDWPGTMLARMVPLVPRATSVTSLRPCGVKGRPDAMVQSPLHCQSPKIARRGVLPVSHRLS